MLALSLLSALCAPALASDVVLSGDFLARLSTDVAAFTTVISGPQGAAVTYQTMSLSESGDWLSGHALQRVPAGRSWSRAAALLPGVNRLPDGRLMVADNEAMVMLDGIPLVAPSLSLTKRDPQIGAPRLPMP